MWRTWRGSKARKGRSQKRSGGRKKVLPWDVVACPIRARIASTMYMAPNRTLRARAIDSIRNPRRIHRVNRQLRARLAPSSQRRAAQFVMLFMLAAVAITAGVLIGSGSRSAVQAAPIPVPFDLQDTVIVREAAPFRPGVPLTTVERCR